MRQPLRATRVGRTSFFRMPLWQHPLFSGSNVFDYYVPSEVNTLCIELSCIGIYVEMDNLRVSKCAHLSKALDRCIHHMELGRAIHTVELFNG